MIFNLLCAPCFAAMGAIKREMNNPKWTLAAVGYMCGFAYVVSLIVYQIGGLITGAVAFNLWTVVAVVLLAGLLYQRFHLVWAACLGEMIGTGVVASILAFPIARYFLGKACGPFTYFVPFMTVAVTGSAIACVLVYILKKNGAMAELSRVANRS